MKKHPTRIVMSGYYGFRNAGDDAVGQAIIQALHQEIPDCDITVLSNDVEVTRRQYGVNAVCRWQPMKVMRTLLSADVVISGGGSLIQDVTSRHGCLYYLGIIFMAQLTFRPVVIYSQGLGPLKGALNRRLTAMAFNHAQAVYVRDNASAQLAREIGVHRQVRVVPDPVLALQADPSLQEEARRTLEKLGWRPDRPLALLALREWPNIDHVADFAALCDTLDEKGYDIGLLSMHYDRDAAIAKAVAGRTKAPAFVINENWDTDMFLAVMNEAELVVGMRLHALIMGAALGKRIMAVSYDPKVDAFMRLMHNDDCLPLDAVSASSLTASLEHALQAEHDQEMARVATLKRFCLLPAEECARIANARR